MNTIRAVCRCGWQEEIPFNGDKIGWRCEKCYVVFDISTDARMVVNPLSTLPMAHFHSNGVIEDTPR